MKDEANRLHKIRAGLYSCASHLLFRQLLLQYL